jgi:1,2-diacylglycerol 3-alpha-glucosyltransferase
MEGLLIMPTIAIYYNFFPHYRKAIINKLSEIYGKSIWFFGDSEGEGGIELMNLDGRQYVVTPRIKINSFEYHIGVIKNALFGCQDVHIFLANPYFVSTWVAVFICKLKTKKVVFWGHGYLNTNSNFLVKKIKAYYFNKADVFLCYSQRAIDLAKVSGVDYKRWVSIGNSLDVDIDYVKKSIANHYNKPSEFNEIKLVAISRLTKNCRYDLLLKALAILNKKSDYRFSVLFIGDGKELSSLKFLSKELGVKCEFIGAIYDDCEISKYMLDCQLAVSPGKIGLTALHCLSNGIPVITHSDFDYQMPEVEAIKEGYTGVFFERDSAESLAESILRAVDTKCLKDNVSTLCFNEILNFYNAERQAEIIDSIVNKI